MAHGYDSTRRGWRFADLAHDPDLQALALHIFECTEGADAADAIETALRIYPRVLAYAAEWDARAALKRWQARNGREAA